MPFPFPPLWAPSAVWVPKTDLNPVPGGQTNNYWASAESNFLSSSLVSVSSSLSSSEAAVNVLSAAFGLAADPVLAWAYTASYSSSLLSSEVWRDAGTGFRVKQVGYGYTGSVLLSSTVAVYAAGDGVTLLAAGTASYFYSGSALVSAAFVRSA